MSWDEFHTEFQMGLTAVTERAAQMLNPVASQVLARMQDLISVIPPQPDRNRAPRFNNYVREIGHFPRSAFYATKKGTWRRKGRVSRIEQGQIRYTSQQSNTRWMTYITGQPSLVVGTLRNETSYGGWVFGPRDASLDIHQAAWHAETGWVSQDAAIEEAMPELNRLMAGVTDEIVSTILGGQ